MDRERGAVERPVAVDDLTAMVDEQQISHANHLEVHPERVDPEVVEELGIARGDVTGGAFVESEVPEQSESGRQVLLAIPAFVLDVVELRELCGDAV